MNEDAAINYNPSADDSSGSESNASSSTEAQLNFEKARHQLLSMNGVEGVGNGATPDGEAALVVFVRDQQFLAQLPVTLHSVKVIAYVTGEVKAF